MGAGGGPCAGDRRPAPLADLGQRPARGGVRGHRAEDLLLGAQRLHVDQVPTTAADRDRYIGKHPTPVMHRGEPAHGQDLRQLGGQPGPVGQHPQPDRSGQRHHALSIGGDAKILAP